MNHFKNIKERDLGLRTVSCCSSNTDMALYRGLRTHVCKGLRNAKAECYIFVITEATGNYCHVETNK